MRVPQSSILNSGVYYDYTDYFSGNINDARQTITTTDLAKAFFSSAPKGDRRLMTLRDAVVGWAGLRTSGKSGKRARQPQNFRCEPGERIGLFRMFSKTDNEVILGQDDRHLNFRISLCVGQVAHALQKRLTISTAVKFNNFFGRTYFLVVKLFHRLIAPRMLRTIIKTLEANAENRLQDGQ